MSKLFRTIALVGAGLMLLPAFAAFAVHIPSMPSFEDKVAERGGFYMTRQKKTLAGRAMVVEATDTSLKLRDKNGAEVRVMLTTDTKLYYRGGKAVASDFQSGDEVRIVARKNFAEAGQWEARMVLNHSLRRVVLEGTVKNLNLTDATFAIEMVSSGIVTVKLAETTPMEFQSDGTKTRAKLADLKNGMTVTVKVQMRVISKTVTEVKSVTIHGEATVQETNYLSTIK